MRQLIILRGPSGSGRNQFIEAQGLSPWLIDQSQLDAIFGDLVTDRFGDLVQDAQQRARARRHLLEILSQKADRGNLIVFKPTDTGTPSGSQASSASDRLISSVVEIARARRYKTLIVDFAPALAASGLAASARGEALGRQIQHMGRRIGLPEGADIAWIDVRKIEGSLLDHVEPSVIDLSAFENVVAIGDIHGCSRTFSQLLGRDGIRADTAYVFLGDYINKGPDSGGVLRRLLAEFVPHQGSYFLTGNHERPLEEWALGQEPAKRVFRQTALPSLEAQGLDRELVRGFLSHTMDGARFHWRGLDILATHGGFARPPERLVTLSAEHLQYGAEAATFDIDRAWEENVLAGHLPDSRKLIQVHGHRNPRGHQVAAGAGTFNLENGVDSGGDMRALILSSSGKSYVARALSVPCADTNTFGPGESANA